MHRRCNLAHLILASVVVLCLTPLMVVVDAQAQIAFVSNRDGHFRDDIPDIPTYEIYVMNADGGNQRRLTNNPVNDKSPSWSPDGKRIAFVSNRDGHVHVIHGGPTDEIYVMDADGGNPQNLTNNPVDDDSPSWSPDGKRIVYASDREEDGHFNYEIYVMDADGGNPQNLSNNPNEDNPNEDNHNGDRYPSWSPDGKRIVFSSEKPGHFIGDFGITDEIYVMDADGGNQQRLTENRVYDGSPSWSPDGKRIAFSSDRNFENFEIYVMDADGGNPQNLTNNPDDDGSPAWLNSPFSVSPAGKKFTMWGWLKQTDR